MAYPSAAINYMIVDSSGRVARRSSPAFRSATLGMYGGATGGDYGYTRRGGSPRSDRPAPRQMTHPRLNEGGDDDDDDDACLPPPGGGGGGGRGSADGITRRHALRDDYDCSPEFCYSSINARKAVASPRGAAAVAAVAAAAAAATAAATKRERRPEFAQQMALHEEPTPELHWREGGVHVGSTRPAGAERLSEDGAHCDSDDGIVGPRGGGGGGLLSRAVNRQGTASWLHDRGVVAPQSVVAANFHFRSDALGERRLW